MKFKIILNLKMSVIFNFIKKYDYFLFLIFIIFLNENFLEYIDQNPPLSEISKFYSRIISLLFIIFFTVYKIYSSKKFLTVIKTFFLFILIFGSIDIFFSILGFGNLFKNNEHLIRRYPSPYDMFAPKPNVRAHNSFGFKGKEFVKFNDGVTVTIAFFGGSTGYNGAPPIINRVGDLLSKKNINNFTYNFSSTSSNHTQHLHRLIKFLDYNFDIIIFYGGGNETEGYYLYDPRAGYPYNFYYKELVDTNFLIYSLIRYSSFFGELESRTGLLSGLFKIKKVYQGNYDEWEKNIVNQYIKDVTIAKNISEKLIKSNYCKKTNFISIFQPLNFIDNKEVNLTSLIKNKMNNEDFFLDYSSLKNKVEFLNENTNRIHITNDSKQIIASNMIEDIVNIIDNCR